VLLFRFIVFIAIGVYAAIASAAPPATLLIVGDSLSAGYGLTQNTGWVDLLQQRLQANRIRYRVVNASISGETSSGGRTRFQSLIKQYQPSTIILQLGANDGLRGLLISVVRRNLDAMIKSAQASKTKLLLVGIRLPINYGKAYREKFQAVYEELARSNNVPLVPSLLADVETKRELFQADGIHPSETAQSILLETIWTPLRLLLTQKP
jgi:acyl-CoA thioesterase I